MDAGGAFKLFIFNAIYRGIIKWITTNQILGARYF
jgi:hypothetical protein